MSQNNNQENDCLTVLCFKVTALTNEKAQAMAAVQQLADKLKTVGKEAKEHNDKALGFVNNIEAQLDLATDSKGDDEKLAKALSLIADFISALRTHLA